MPENEKILAIAKAAIENSTEIIAVCRQIIQDCAPQQQVKPRLIGLRTASKLVGFSQRFLRGQLEKGELTGWQNAKKGRWMLDPEKLVSEMKAGLTSRAPKTTVKRRKRTLPYLDDSET